MANSNRDALGRWASAQVSSGTDPAQRGAASSFAALPSASRSGASGAPPSISSATDPAAQQRQSGGSGAVIPDAASADWGNLHDASAKLLGSGGGASKGGGLKLGGPGRFNAQQPEPMDLSPTDLQSHLDRVVGGGSDDNPGPGPGSPPAPGFGAALRAGGYSGQSEGPGQHQVQAADVPRTALMSPVPESQGPLRASARLARVRLRPAARKPQEPPQESPSWHR